MEGFPPHEDPTTDAIMTPGSAAWAPGARTVVAPTAVIGWFGAPVAMQPWVYLPPMAFVAPMSAAQVLRDV